MSAKIHVHNSSSMIGREICFFILGFWGFGGTQTVFLGCILGFWGFIFPDQGHSRGSKPPKPQNPKFPKPL